jgi:hypothetical protein
MFLLHSNLLKKSVLQLHRLHVLTVASLRVES